MNTESDEVDFCQQVGDRVESLYGLLDGDDLCFNLLESGVIDASASVSQAVIIVAMHIAQA